MAPRVMGRKTAVVLALCVFALPLLYGLSFWLENGHRELLFLEGGLVESATAFGFFLCALLIVREGGEAYVRKHNYFLLLPVLLGLRELDAHKCFTTMSMTKSRFFLSPDVAVWEKVVGLAVIGLVLWIVVTIFRKHFRGFLAGLKVRSPLSISVLAMAVLTVVSKSLDGFPRKLRAIGIETGYSMSEHLAEFEEVLEMGIPVLLIFAFCVYWPTWRTLTNRP